MEIIQLASLFGLMATFIGMIAVLTNHDKLQRHKASGLVGIMIRIMARLTHTPVVAPQRANRG